MDLDPYDDPTPNFIHGEFELRPGYPLKQLSEDPAWSSMLDIICLRTYFERLWTLQEIVLSTVKNTIVCCESLSFPWKNFKDAGQLLYESTDYLGQTLGVNELDILAAISSQSNVQDLIRSRDTYGQIIFKKQEIFSAWMSASSRQAVVFVATVETEHSLYWVWHTMLPDRGCNI